MWLQPCCDLLASYGALAEKLSVSQQHLWLFFWRRQSWNFGKSIFLLWLKSRCLDILIATVHYLQRRGFIVAFKIHKQKVRLVSRWKYSLLNYCWPKRKCELFEDFFFHNLDTRIFYSCISAKNPLGTSITFLDQHKYSWFMHNYI